jgi:transposase
MKKNRTYTKEFKRQALGLINRGGQPLATIAKSLGIPSSTLVQWDKKAKNEGEEIFDGAETITPEQATISRLEKELAEVKMEREILKDAISIFGKKKL